MSAATGDALDRLSPAEKVQLRACLPTEDEIKVGWATPLLDKSDLERRVLVAAQLEVLEILEADPAAWCARALALAEKERRAHADR